MLAKAELWALAHQMCHISQLQKRHTALGGGGDILELGSQAEGTLLTIKSRACRDSKKELGNNFA